MWVALFFFSGKLCAPHCACASRVDALARPDGLALARLEPHVASGHNSELGLATARAARHHSVRRLAAVAGTTDTQRQADREHHEHKFTANHGVRAPLVPAGNMDTRHAGDAHKHRAASACVAAGENDPANRHAGAVSGLSLVAAPRAHRTGWPGDATLGCLTAVVVASVAAALWLWCPIAPINTVPLPPLTPRPRPVLPAAFARLADVADATADLGAWLSGVQPLIDDSLLDPSTAVAPCYDEYAEWCHHVRQWASVGESIQAALLSIIHDVVIGTVSVMRAIRPLLEQARLDFNRENKGRACRGVEGVVAAVIDPAKAVQTAHEELEAVLPRILDMATESTQRGEALQRLWMKLKRRPRFLRSLDRMLRERAQSQGACAGHGVPRAHALCTSRHGCNCRPTRCVVDLCC